MDLEQLYSKVLKEGKELSVDMCIVLAVCLIVFWGYLVLHGSRLSICDMFTFIYFTRMLYNIIYLVVMLITKKKK